MRHPLHSARHTPWPPQTALHTQGSEQAHTRAHRHTRNLDATLPPHTRVLMRSLSQRTLLLGSERARLQACLSRGRTPRTTPSASSSRARRPRTACASARVSRSPAADRPIDRSPWRFAGVAGVAVETRGMPGRAGPGFCFTARLWPVGAGLDYYTGAMMSISAGCVSLGQACPLAAASQSAEHCARTEPAAAPRGAVKTFARSAVQRESLGEWSPQPLR